MLSRFTPWLPLCLPAYSRVHSQTLTEPRLSARPEGAVMLACIESSPLCPKSPIMQCITTKASTRLKSNCNLLDIMALVRGCLKGSIPRESSVLLSFLYDSHIGGWGVVLPLLFSSPIPTSLEGFLLTAGLAIFARMECA